MIYLDYAATTPVDERVLEAMNPYFCEVFANPSSKHRCGRRATRAVHQARTNVADLIGADPKEIVFTSGASEATNLALKGVADQYDEPKHFISSSFEHKATLAALKDLENLGHEVTLIAPNRDGVVDPQDFADAIQDNTVLITLIHVNNEIGTIQPIEEIAQIAQANDVLFHVDATQSFGKMPIDVDDGIDMLSLSAHKVYGPKGVGALFIADGVELKSQNSGGSQERGIRAGTLNVPGIVGLGEAARIADQEMAREWARLEELEHYWLQLVQDRIGHVYLQGAHGAKVPWISNICFEGLDGGTLRDALCDQGVCVSRSSACAKSNAASHVLEAIECPKELSECAIRFSFGRKTNEERLQKALETLEDVVEKMRNGRYSPASSPALSPAP
jgi:cysteine desulfurase